MLQHFNIYYNNREYTRVASTVARITYPELGTMTPMGPQSPYDGKLRDTDASTKFLARCIIHSSSSEDERLHNSHVRLDGPP